MSGPIVRTGATPEFWKNWDRVFGAKNATAGKSTAKAAKKTTQKAAKPQKSAKAKKK